MVPRPRHAASRATSRGPAWQRAYVLGCLVVITVALVSLSVSAYRALTKSHGTRQDSNQAPFTADAHAPAPTLVAPSASIVEENARPGNPEWPIPGDPATWDKVRGFADQVSAQRGDTLGLYVSTAAKTFHVEAYRLGFYGGAGARLVWRSDDVRGQQQAPARIDSRTGMRDAPWSKSTSIVVGDDWTPGMYMLKLVSANGGQSLVPLTVRDDSSQSTYLVQSAVTTWQAYNGWGGANLYTGPKLLSSTRSRVVSFDRPYDGTGSGEFFGREDLLVSQVEAMGLDVSYTTDVDTHARPDLLKNHKVFIAAAHDEYWSKEMRDGVEGARDAGVNLMFIGANASFRRIRLDPSELGPNRHEVNYRVASEDPLNNVDPDRVTTSWRDNPHPRPESSMIGGLYECNPVEADMVVGEASSWILAGTGLRDGDRLAKLVGNEYDRVTPEMPTPPNIEVVAHSPVVCRGVKSFSDVTYYTAPSGAGVFATGTFQVEAHMGIPCPDSKIEGLDCQVRKFMSNVLVTFGHGPAALEHPSQNNLDRFGIKKGYVHPAPG